MALTNRDRIDRALELLRKGLTPFVERELDARLGADWVAQINRSRRQPVETGDGGEARWDSPALLSVMWEQWNSVFRYTLAQPQRTLVSELWEVRNRWAHEHTFSTDETYRALDSVRLLLESVGDGQGATSAASFSEEVLRTKFAEAARSRARRTETVEGSPQAGLPPWREVITPHEDVASGRYAQAEFAADLAQVVRGEGVAEYTDPVEFFRRTYLTEGLTRLLTDAIRRLSGAGGEPVVELQTNFGGGKTHSMLALYHLFGGKSASELPGLEEIASGAGVGNPPAPRRCVLVGYDFSAASPSEKEDGTVVRTLWGEMAYQLGGAEAYRLVQRDDESSSYPASGTLTELFEAFGPAVIIIDEWVAFLRNLYGVRGLPAGSFESNLSFAQALTQAARASERALVVGSLPASSIEIGGEGGEEALAQLKNTFERMGVAWTPASAEEGFEIIRRRLFDESSEDQVAKDMVIKKFTELYGSHRQQFPSGTPEGDYRRRMAAAYPIHPELFERLHNDWSSLPKFQRTRGILRLLASVIHTLWEREDKSLLILPSTIPMESETVRSELTRYLEEHWEAVIAKDIDGPDSVPLAIDREYPNLGRYSAARRAARTIYMGSAPISEAGRSAGIDERSVLLGCVQPGESPATFGDAMRHLTDNSTFLYREGGRYWYSTKPSVARLAADRAGEIAEADIDAEIERRIKGIRERAAFARVHPCPADGSQVPDEAEGRLVILPPSRAHTGRSEDSQALREAAAILATRGNSPRIYRNTLVFLAADARRISDLRQSVAMEMAWASIAEDRVALDLTESAYRQATSRKQEMTSQVEAQLGEAYSWALSPSQPDGRDPTLEWARLRVNGSAGEFVARVSSRLVSEEALLTELGAERLRLELDRWLWTNEDHIEIATLYDHFCRYPYLPRLRDESVLGKAIEAGVRGGEGVGPSFAYARGYDPDSGRYEDLVMGGHGDGHPNTSAGGLVVKAEVAHAQIASEDRDGSDGHEQKEGQGGDAVEITEETGSGEKESGRGEGVKPHGTELAHYFHASATLDEHRVGRDAGTIADQVLSKLTSVKGTNLKVKLEIEADIPEGAPEKVQRDVSEDCNTLGFDSHEFE